MFDFTTPVETKPDVFTLEALMPWLESFPPEQEYCWANGGACLFYQYGVAMGLNSDIAYDEATRRISMSLGLPDNCEPTNIAAGVPHTFGAATIRCRAAIEMEAGS